MTDVLYFFYYISLINQTVSDSDFDSEFTNDFTTISNSVDEHQYRKRRFDSSPSIALNETGTIE